MKEKINFILVFLIFYSIFCGLDIVIIKIINPSNSILGISIFIIIYYLLLSTVVGIRDNIKRFNLKKFNLLFIIFSVYLASLIYKKLGFNFNDVVLLSIFIFIKFKLIKYISKKREVNLSKYNI